MASKSTITIPATKGLNHLGLSVKKLDASIAFFVDCLGWEESGRDDSYPRSAVSDGTVRITLWQVDHSKAITEFDRKQNVGLHHVALEVESEAKLEELATKLETHPGVTIEFLPELVGAGPRKHMMCYEPGGNRVEFIWQGK